MHAGPDLKITERSYCTKSCLHLFAESQRSASMGQPTTYQRSAIILMIAVILFNNCDLQEAKTLPPWLPWFSYTKNVDDLDHYLKDKVPIGQRNVFLFARKVIIASDVDLTSSYYDPQVPFDLTIICETLRVERSGSDEVDIYLSGDNAPDYVSAAPRTVLYQPIVYPWTGKTGADGGSIYIYAKEKTGSDKLSIYASGGKGGRGQAGWKGKDGTDATWINPATDGQDGGDGARGGNGGDAGEIVINSMSNPSSIVENTVSNGGAGGSGGPGGKGGAGSQGSGWGFRGGHKGSTGDPGRSGDDGSSTMAEKNMISDAAEFYRSVPIIGTYLQRALNAEMYRMWYARRYRSNSVEWNLIRDHVSWIREVAEANGYDIVQERCNHMIDLCNRYEHDGALPTYTVSVQKTAIKDHFDNLRHVAEQSVNINLDTLNQRIENDPLMTELSSYARSFHHLYKRFDKFKERYENALEIADLFGGVSRPSSEIRNFLTSSSFSSKLVDKIMSIAQSKNYINDALDTAAQEGEVVVDAGEIIEVLAAGVEAAPILAVLGAERVVEPQVEKVAVKAFGMRVVSQLHSLTNWGSFFDSIHDALTSYERDVQSRADNSNRSKRSTAKARKDQKVKNTARVNRRLPFLRPGRRNRLAQAEPPPQNRKPNPKELTGKFLGVLDKRDEIEANDNQVVVTFDAIRVEFYVERGQGLNLDNLDAEQTVELFSQLENYASPFSNSPSFFITTTVNQGDISENAVGEWFQFDCEFTNDGTDEAVEFSIINTIVEDELSQVFSLVVSDDISATVPSTSIRQLSASLQIKVVLFLELSSIGEQFGRRKRQVSGSSHTCAPSSNKITKVDVMNVGQGSCNLLYKESSINNVEVVFDLGYGKGRITGVPENQLIDKISHAPSIIISHWDLDHYRYLARSSISILETHKDFTASSNFGINPGVTVRRAVRSIPEDDLHLIDAGHYQNTIQVYGSSVLNLDLRTTTLTTGRNKNDVGAITAAIIDNNCKPYLLIPGDASYYYVPSQQTVEDYYLNFWGLSLYSHSVGRLKYLVATHHGSTRNIGIIPDGEGNSGYVIYSYGEGNRYGHSVGRARLLYNPQPRPGWNYEYLTAGSNHGVTVSLDLTRNVWRLPVQS